MSQPYLLVTGDFVQTGGMDRANYALASYLSSRPGAEVHLVAHRAADELTARPGVTLHRVPRPRGSHLLGAPLLDCAGRDWARRLSAVGGRVVVNGGNCRWGDINWVHYVHAAWTPRAAAKASPLRRLKGLVFDRYARRTERKALGMARLVITNSRRDPPRRHRAAGRVPRTNPYGLLRHRPRAVPAPFTRGAGASARTAGLGGLGRAAGGCVRGGAGRLAQGVRHAVRCLAAAGP